MLLPTLNDGSIVELEGSGELTPEMTQTYWLSVVGVEIGKACTSIGDRAFDGFSSLTGVTIPDSVTSIGNYAFSSCRFLTSITIPNSVTSIRWNSFNSCSSLTGMTVDSNNTVYDSRNNCNAIIETSTNKLIAACENTVIPNTVESIGVGAYSRVRLTSVTIPDSVTTIDRIAFSSCIYLKSVTIGTGVTSIGNEAFVASNMLQSITSLATTAPTIQRDTFSGVKTSGTLTVPSGSIGYDVWMSTDDYYLGKYNWTKVEQ